MSNTVRLGLALSLVGLAVTGCATDAERSSRYTDSDSSGKKMKRGELSNCTPATGTGPVLLDGRLPKYPRKAARYQRGGTASTIFTVTETGEVEIIQIFNATTDEFAAEMESAVKTWVFEPATNQGETVAVNCLMNLSFDTGDR